MDDNYERLISDIHRVKAKRHPVAWQKYQRLCSASDMERVSLSQGWHYFLLGFLSGCGLTGSRRNEEFDDAL